MDCALALSIAGRIQAGLQRLGVDSLLPARSIAPVSAAAKLDTGTPHTAAPVGDAGSLTASSVQVVRNKCFRKSICQRAKTRLSVLPRKYCENWLPSGKSRMVYYF